MRQRDKYADVCTYCALHSKIQEWHSITTCGLIRSDQLYESYMAWKKGIKYSKPIHGSVCYKCHIPQGDGDALHPTFSTQAVDCDYRDMLLPLVFAILTQPHLRDRAQTQFPDADLSTLKSAALWFNAKPVLGHVTNLSALFLWYCEKH